MSQILPPKKVETPTPASSSARRASLSRRELLQKAGWVAPVIAVVGLTHMARPVALQASLIN